jgi:hypothetical protein
VAPPGGRSILARRDPGSATITNVFRNRRFACLFLGLWLGAAVSVDFLVAQNFSTIDPFISASGSPSVSAQIKQAGQKSIRFILRRNAAEENARIFETWEWSQIGIATVFFSLIMFGERPPVSALVLIPAMFVIVLLQHFILTPQVVSFGREDVPRILFRIRDLETAAGPRRRRPADDSPDTGSLRG